MALDYVLLSKTLSHALRHQPWVYELELDEEGWTDIASVLDAVRHQHEQWQNLTQQDLEDMIARADKPRFEISQGRIRAIYGHSLPGRLRKVRATPPELLYHGTSPASAKRILEVGLQPMRRQYVHLSADTATALEVGKRKAARPVILRIDAARAAADDIPFYEGHARVWLADHIPPAYIHVSPD